PQNEQHRAARKVQPKLALIRPTRIETTQTEISVQLPGKFIGIWIMTTACANLKSPPSSKSQNLELSAPKILSSTNTKGIANAHPQICETSPRKGLSRNEPCTDESQ